MNMCFARFSVPVLGDGTKELYEKLYGDAGDQFVSILNTSPDEIAVISRLIAYVKDKKGVQSNGCSENGTRDRVV